MLKLDVTQVSCVILNSFVKINKHIFCEKLVVFTYCVSICIKTGVWFFCKDSCI